jgi:hypothetical protein
VHEFSKNIDIENWLMYKKLNNKIIIYYYYITIHINLNW